MWYRSVYYYGMSSVPLMFPVKMPPKKMMKIDPKQRRLDILFHDSNSTDQQHLVSSSDVQDANVCSASNVMHKLPKVRQFQPKWLKTYSWLRYDNGCANKNEDFMYCEICTDNKKVNGMNKIARNRNFQNSTLTRHADLADHKLCLIAPELRNDFEKCSGKLMSDQDKAITALLKVVKWMADEDMPLNKFKSFVNLLHELGVRDLDVLRKSNINYESSVTASELLESLAEFANNAVTVKIKKSPVVTILADESTDISNRKRLVMYAQTLNEDFIPECHYVCNVECSAATGKGIAASIMKEMSEKGVPVAKIMSLGSDGASAMMGKEKGVAAILRRENPHMHNVHCVAHRLALSTSQAAEKIEPLKKHQHILTDLFYYFKGSSQREARLHAIQEVLDDPCLIYKELHSVRWLSYFSALTAVWRTLDSWLTYLAEASHKDHKAGGMKKKIATESFISTTYMMMDAMAPVTILSQFFQKENVDVALVKVKTDECITNLQNLYSFETPYMQKLQEDLKDNKFKGNHQITKNNFNLEKITKLFIDSLVENIQSRFPADDLLTSFGILAMRPISMMSKIEVDTYGDEEIDRLCTYYGEAKTVQWETNRSIEKKTSEPVIDSVKAKIEWTFLKKVVLAEKYPQDVMCKLWHLIDRHHREDFPNLLKLAALALTSAVHTAGCEHGFSAQNRILVKARNRLNIETPHKLMAVKLCTVPFDYKSVLQAWRSKKDRRIYELK